MERTREKFVGRQVISWALLFFMVLPTLHILAIDDVDNPDDDQSTVPRLYFEPIAGLTTIRHFAPGQTAIPLGTVLELFLDAPEDAQVTFTGATMTSRNADGIKATCFLNQEGPAFVAAISELSDGTTHIAACRLEVIAIAIGDISATVTTPAVAPFDLDENATNAETMSKYFVESIADFVETTTSVSDAVGLDGRRPRSGPAPVTRHFRTSTYRHINFHAEIDPPAFAPLMEWRIDGLARALGADRKETFRSVGEHTVSVGPPDRAIGVVIDTYSVTITSHASGADIVPQGEWIVFEAVTDPLGLESGINWVSSTKYGTASPVLGRGRTFTVQFNDTFGVDEETGKPFEWLGVRADNALFGQDQKPCTILSVSTLSAAEGDSVIITGFAFDPNPMNNCVFLGGSGARAEVLSASITQIECVVGAVPNIQSGDVVVVRGIGTVLPPEVFDFGDAQHSIPAAISFVSDTECSFPVAFELNAASANTDGAVVGANNDVCVTLTGSWTDGDTIDVDLHLDMPGFGNWVEIVFQDDFSTIPAGGNATAAECASDYATIISTLYAGDGVVASSAGAKITITVPDGMGNNTLEGGSFGSISR